MEKVSKYKKGLVGEIKAEKKFEKKQSELKEKYNLDVPNDIVVVEKTNAYKFTVNTLAAIIKKAATICLLILAAMGLMTLIYPDVRKAFVEVVNELINQLSAYLPFLAKNM